MMERNINSPLTSSCGRLFDAVAALVGVRHTVNYEAQAAIELEMAIDGQGEDAYSLSLEQNSELWIIRTRSLFEAMIGDLTSGVSVGAMSRRFHNGLANTFVQIAKGLRVKTGLNRICLSGGTFHNVYLSGKLERSLTAHHFEVFTQREVPAGDGGLSLGQAVVGARRFLAAKRNLENNKQSSVD
jgi:hydrogenase maturation protein HypF